MNEFNANEAMDVLHDYAIRLNDLHDEASELYDAYSFVPNSLTIRIDNDVFDIYKVANPVADNLKAFYLPSSHGGFRKGAGRPQSPSKQMRVPEDLVHVVDALIEVYKSGQWDSDYRTRISRYIEDTDSLNLRLHDLSL